MSHPLDQVEAFLKRFVVYPSEHALVAHTLWIAHCHLMDCWDTTPRLAFMSAERMSGKTRALEITKLLVPNGHVFLNASPAALVRLINQGHEDGVLPTIMHDEIDNVFNLGNADPTNATLLSVFNQGYTPSATVPRCVGQGTTFEVKQMPCYAAIAFAGLRGLPDTLESRTIKIRMKRRANDEVKESFRRRRHVQEAEPIAETLSGWCVMYKEDFLKAVASDGPAMPDGIEDRTADCWEPLLAIADVAADWTCIEGVPGMAGWR
jgi:hypothetical protein